MALRTTCRLESLVARLLHIKYLPSLLQAASGAGQAAMDELEQQTREVLDGKPPTQNIFPFQVSMDRH